MISGSNEQLRQELEYILLKPDCHCRWISKMQSGRVDTLEEGYVIKFCFKLGKNYATETYGMLQTAFFKGVQEEIPLEEASTLQIGQWHFQQDHTPAHNSILVTDYLTKMGSKTVPQPPYSINLAPWDLWLLPKLRGCRYETIEEMKEAVKKVIDTLTQEDFHGTFQKWLERYNKCIAAGGDNFEGD